MYGNFWPANYAGKGGDPGLNESSCTWKARATYPPSQLAPTSGHAHDRRSVAGGGAGTAAPGRSRPSAVSGSEDAPSQVILPPVAGSYAETRMYETQAYADGR